MAGLLYRWEEHNHGLEHKCGTCATVLSSPRAKKTCFGVHEEACIRYHKTLFYVGQSNHCDACHKTVEQHDKRHREIAALVHSIKSLDSGADDGDAQLLRDRDRKSKRAEYNEGSQAWDDESITLNEEEQPEAKPSSADARRVAKAERRIARHQSRVKVMVQEDLDAIEACLHPEASSRPADHWIKSGQGLANNTVIEDNIAFQKGAFTHSSIRGAVLERRFAKANELKRQVGWTVEEENEILGPIIAGLGLDSVSSKGTKERKSLYGKLRAAIMEDLVAVENEQAETMQRMAGYWRYANRRTYNEMVKNNELWDWATGQKLPEVEELPCIEEEDDAGGVGPESAVSSQSTADIETYDDDFDEDGLARFARDRMAGGFVAKLSSSFESPVNSPRYGSGSSAVSRDVDDDSFEGFWDLCDPSFDAASNPSGAQRKARGPLTPKASNTMPSPYDGKKDQRSFSEARLVHDASPLREGFSQHEKRPLRHFASPGTLLPHATDIGNRYTHLENNTPAPSEESRPAPRKPGTLIIPRLPENAEPVTAEEGWQVMGPKHKLFPLLDKKSGRKSKGVAGNGMDFARALRKEL